MYLSFRNPGRSSDASGTRGITVSSRSIGVFIPSGFSIYIKGLRVPRAVLEIASYLYAPGMFFRSTYPRAPRNNHIGLHAL